MPFPSRKRILCIDDEPSMLQMLQMILESAGHTCFLATGGPEGLQILLDERPDLVILDYMMPGMTGGQVFHRLHQDEAYQAVKETPLIMLTAKTDNEEEQSELLALGLEGYLPKPFQYLELLIMIDDIPKNAKVPDQIVASSV